MLDIAIHGITPLSTIDYPDALSTVCFCQGCGWQCSFCHNRHLLGRKIPGQVDWNAFYSFLEQRRGFLDAVVFSGGEPLLQKALPTAMIEVKKLGFQVGLHTSGALPERLSSVLPHLDWLALDIKAPFHLYEAVTKRAGSGEKVRQSLKILHQSTVEKQIRITRSPFLQQNRHYYKKMIADLKTLGVVDITFFDYRQPPTLQENRLLDAA
ncbi:anaerobic ribonucleoside-triphosphate reductase activating protein [Magnetococcales bacterium HHB-1]